MAAPDAPVVTAAMRVAARAGAAAAVAVAAVAVIAAALGHPPTHHEADWLAASTLAAAAAALCYARVRSWLERGLSRFVPQPRPAPHELVELLELRQAQGARLDDVLVELAESLRGAFDLRAAALWSGGGGVYERVAAAPPRPSRRLVLSPAPERVLARMHVVSEEWLSVWLPELRGVDDQADLAAPITHAGQLVGFVSLERRPGAAPGEGLDAELDHVVGELCHRLAPLVHNARLDSALRESLAEVRRQSNELTASRARVVRAADDERRRIERNLHDGVQQHLVGVTLELRLARELSGIDPARADEILAQLEGELEHTLEELRALARGVYPPMLRDQGLGPVVAAAGRRASLPTHVSVETTRRHSPDVEATVYFCCLEAIANACKHAGPEAALTVRVWEQAGAVLFEVADDGRGFRAREPRGIGLLSLEDRVGALGGTLVVESTPGAGTRIHGVVPAASAA